MSPRIPCAVVALLAPIFSSAADVAAPRYAGPEVCAKCHRDVAASQITTAMAKTWNATATLPLPTVFDQKIQGTDPAVHYEIRRLGERFEFSITDHGTKTVLPVEAVIGGKRHGVSFLARVRELNGLSLSRPALVEARYAYSPHGSLVLSPGFETGKPATLEDALGRVLSPTFEQRCLTCHGQPGTLGAGAHGGVRCESCHGPAAAHVESMTGNGRHPIFPESLAKAAGSRRMDVCSQCHTGLSSVNHADPVPGDLLVSSQVPALQHSECFRQTGGSLTCTNCHDPHRDSPAVPERSTKTCLNCHASANPQHAAICPINASSGCLGCHMPPIESNGFKLTDHWIAVHPEQGVKAEKHDDALRSLVRPKREYLQIIVTDDRAKAEAALARVTQGESFYDVAHEVSMDATAPGGGFIGDMELASMDSHLADAASHLWYGETSGIVDQSSRYIILHRLPRDFRWQANQLFLEAQALRTQGNRKAAADKAQAALRVYPYFLRALVFMGSQIGQTGDTARAREILAFAVQSYPQDAFTQFDYALTLASQPAAQIEAFRHAIELDSDIVAAYESLGAALAGSGQMDGAIQTFRQGLTIDPLSAILNYDLGLALKQEGDTSGSNRFVALAARLDPEIASRLATAK